MRLTSNPICNQFRSKSFLMMFLDELSFWSCLLHLNASTGLSLHLAFLMSVTHLHDMRELPFGLFVGEVLVITPPVVISRSCAEDFMYKQRNMTAWSLPDNIYSAFSSLREEIINGFTCIFSTQYMQSRSQACIWHYQSTSTQTNQIYSLEFVVS